MLTYLRRQPSIVCCFTLKFLEQCFKRIFYLTGMFNEYKFHNECCLVNKISFSKIVTNFCMYLKLCFFGRVCIFVS